jgi:NADH dehydrogenase
VKNKRKIVILGGGYGGVECTRKLEEYFRNDDDIEIVLISEDNFLLFTPMLPQVAAGMLATRHNACYKAYSHANSYHCQKNNVL